MKKLLFVAAVILTSWTSIQAQISTPAASPSATLKQTVGLTDVEIEYSRPSMKGREIFSADGLVPFDKIWRTGANAVTKVSFSDDVMIEGQKVSGGSYAVLSKPGADMWAVHFYPYEGRSWGSYVEKTPAVAAMVKPIKSGMTVESFLITIDQLSNEGATIMMMWDNTAVPVKLGVMVDEKVMANIDQVMAGPSANDYYQAAAYYHEAGKDLNKALEWITIATDVEDPKFWQVRRKALILSDMGKKAEAIAAAKLSMELAQKAGNEDYVRMNEKSIKEWSM